MATAEVVPPQRRLHTVQSRLLVMEYREPLGADSLDLVERLLGDLIATSESYEKLQQREERLSQDLALAQAQIIPLRKTISRLTRENNQLHSRMIKQAEHEDESENHFKRQVGVLKGQLEDLRFLSNQKDQKLREQSDRMEELKMELERLVQQDTHARGANGGKHGAAVDITAAPGNICPLRQSSRDGGQGFEEEAGGEAGGPLLVQALQRQVTELQATVKGLEEDKQGLVGKLEAREAEMERIGQLVEDDLDHGKGAARLVAQSARKANVRIVEQLHSQVDFLNSQLAAREAQVQQLMNDQASGARDARRALQAQVSQLQDDKARLLEQVRALEPRGAADGILHRKQAHERRVGVGGEEASTEGAGGVSRTSGPSRASEAVQPRQSDELRRVQEALDAALSEKAGNEALLRQAQMELRGVKEEREQMKDRVVDLHAQKDHLAADLESVKAQLHDATVQRDARSGSVEALAGEQRQLEETVQHLEADLDDKNKEAFELKQKLERASQENNHLVALVEEANKRAGELDGLVDMATREEQMLRKELASMQRHLQDTAEAHEAALQQLQASSTVQTQSQSDAMRQLRQRLEEQQQSRNAVELKVQELSRELEAREQEAKTLGAALAQARMAQSLRSGDPTVAAEGEIRTLKQRLAESEARREVLEATVGEHVRAAHASEVETIAQQAARADAEVGSVDLMRALTETERALVALQMDKTSLEATVKQLKEDMGQAHAAVTEAELVNHQRTREVERLTEEIRSLKADTAVLSRGRAHGQERSSELEDELANTLSELRSVKERERVLLAEAERLKAVGSVTQADKDELRVELERARREAVRQRAAHEDTSVKLEAARADAVQKGEQVAQLKALFTQLQSAREQLGKKLHQTYEHVARLEERERESLDRIAALERKVEDKQEEVDRVKRALAQLDEERDALQAALDEQQEAASQRERDRGGYERRLRSLESEVQDEQNRTKAAAAALASKEKEVRLLQGQISGLQHENAETRKALHARFLELKAVSEDLQMMTRENQVTNGELATLSREREELRAKLQAALNRSEKVEQLLRVSQIEKDDLLAAYKALCDERKRLEAGADELAKSRTRLSKSLEEMQLDLGQTRAALQTAEAELQRRAADNGALERQLDNLSRKLHAAHRHLEAQEDEIRRLSSDLIAQKKAAGNNVAVLKTLEARAAGSGEEIVLARGRLASLERERDSLSRMLAEERSHVTELERIIEAARAREAAASRERTDLMRNNLQLREALRQAGQPVPSHNTSLFHSSSALTLSPASRASDAERGDSKLGERSRSVSPSPGCSPRSVGGTAKEQEQEDQEQNNLSSYLESEDVSQSGVDGDDRGADGGSDRGR